MFVQSNLKDMMYRGNPSSFPLTPPQEFADNLSHRSESPAEHKSIPDDTRSSVIHSVKSGIASVESTSYSSSACLSPQSTNSTSPFPQHSRTQENCLTPPVIESPPLYYSPIFSKGIQTTTGNFQEPGAFYEASFGVPKYLSSLPSDVPYKPYFSGKFSTSSDIPRPFKNYAKKHIASLRESEEFSKFKDFMMTRMQNVSSMKELFSDESSEQGVSAINSTDEQCSLENLNESEDLGDIKSPGYWERRRKNNVAAKKSRDLRRQKEDELAIFAAFLDQENEKLKMENMQMLKRCKYLEKCLQFNEQPLVSTEFDSCTSLFNYVPPTGMPTDHYMEEYLGNSWEKR